VEQKLNFAPADGLTADVDAAAKTCRVRVPVDGSAIDTKLTDWEELTMSMSLGLGLSITARRPDDPPDVTPPELTSATVAGDGETVTLVFTEPVTVSGAGFELSGSNALTYSSGSGTDTLVLTADAPVFVGEVVTLDYTPGNCADLAGNALAAISGAAVTNDSEQIEPGSVTFNTPGSEVWEVPAGVGSVRIEVVGGGGARQDNASASTLSGISGGGGAGYAACTLGGALMAAEGKLTITVGAGATSGPFPRDPGEDSKVECGATTVCVGGGGGMTAGGTGSVTVHANITDGATDKGDAGSGQSGGKGGAGGKGGGDIGGAGGAGGNAGQVGQPGVQPGGGGGGAGGNTGFGTKNSGRGGNGSVTISWPT